MHKEWYDAHFEREYNEARSEFLRLSNLFKDVCWYNFETHARHWRDPWHVTEPDSRVDLIGVRARIRSLQGHRFEHVTFHPWYSGTVKDAPHLPPHVLLKDLKEAREYMHHCDAQRTATTDWAPGGSKYEHLRRTTLVGFPTTS